MDYSIGKSVTSRSLPNKESISNKSINGIQDFTKPTKISENGSLVQVSFV